MYIRFLLEPVHQIDASESGYMTNLENGFESEEYEEY